MSKSRLATASCLTTTALIPVLQVAITASPARAAYPRNPHNIQAHPVKESIYQTDEIPSSLLPASDLSVLEQSVTLVENLEAAIYQIGPVSGTTASTSGTFSTGKGYELLISQSIDEQSETNSSEEGSIETKREILQQASAIATGMRPSGKQYAAYTKIAVAYSKIGDIEEARNLLSKVPTEFDRTAGTYAIKSYMERLSQLASAYAAIGDIETATALLEKVLALIATPEALECRTNGHTGTPFNC